jgi:hypothetical protein
MRGYGYGLTALLGLVSGERCTDLRRFPSDPFHGNQLENAVNPSPVVPWLQP